LHVPLSPGKKTVGLMSSYSPNETAYRIHSYVETAANAAGPSQRTGNGLVQEIGSITRIVHPLREDAQHDESTDLSRISTSDLTGAVFFQVASTE